MAIKTILVPVEAADYRDDILSAAVAFAELSDSYIEGCALRAPVYDAIGVGAMGGGMAIPPDPPAESPEGVRDLFVDFMRQAGVAQADAPQSHFSFGWRRTELLGDYQMAEYARVFDLVVTGRPSPKDTSSPRLETIESCLFEGARPVLVVPSGKVEKIGETIVISWNCSTEAARAVSVAMGLLEAARRVVVLTVEGGTVPGPTGAQLCATLKAHGIEPEEHTAPARDGKIGKAILRTATELGAGLLVKGAYTHSRLRQRIFGGATHHLLHHADLPVLVAS